MPATVTNTESPSHSKGGFKPRALLVTAVIGCIFLGSHILRQSTGGSGGTGQQTRAPGSCQRIIALAPSTVEIVYQLGMGQRLVGVSRYANHPPEARQKPDVGGYLDLNYEQLLGLHPDCVILLEEQSKLAPKLAAMGIHTVSVNHNHTRGIIESILTIGRELGRPEAAQGLVADLEGRVEQLTAPHRNAPSPPRVLVCISRDTTSEHPSQLMIAGNAGFHRELVRMAGGVNAYQGSVSFPAVSREKLIALNPDLIIDLVNTATWEQTGGHRLRSQWSAFAELSAVRNGRVAIIHGDQHLIPGPRFDQTLEQFVRAIHP